MAARFRGSPQPEASCRCAERCLGMDFVAVRPANGRRIGTLTIVDLFTRGCLGIEVGFRLRSQIVVTALNHLKYDRGLPNRIFCDDRLELLGVTIDHWAYSNQVKIDFRQ